MIIIIHLALCYSFIIIKKKPLAYSKVQYIKNIEVCYVMLAYCNKVICGSFSTENAKCIAKCQMSLTV